MMKIPNGRSKGHSAREFDARSLKSGTRHELEHTKSRRIARRIAMDHLIEDPSYYRKLDVFERSTMKHVRRSGKRWVVLSARGRVQSHHRTRKLAEDAAFTIHRGKRRSRSRHEPAAELRYRRRKPRGAIMKPATFRAIERRAAASGARDPEAVAGAAYWRTVRAKYTRSQHRRKR